MRGMIPRLALGGLLVLARAVCAGEDRWVIRFHSFANLGGIPGEPCTYISWADRLGMRNTTTQAATVRLLGVSNGQISSSAREITVAAGKSFVDTAGIDSGWFPVPPGTGGPIWVNHLDVPAGVVIASRGEAWASGGPPCGVGSDPRIFGGVALPVFDRLAPAGAAQYHLAVDLGSNEFGMSADAHINVGVYNAGSGPGTATIEIRRECDDALIDRRVVTVPANSLVQFNGFVTNGGQAASGCVVYRDYAVVTVDQPSLSYVATASNQIPARIPVSVSIVR